MQNIISNLPIQSTIVLAILFLIWLSVIGSFVYLAILMIRALRKYVKSQDIRKESTAVRHSLGEALKEHRTSCHMTQEFVAEHLGVSRQAVSKWENGTSDPSTTNLLALAKLYDISAEELLRSISQ